MNKKFTCNNIEQLLDMATYFIEEVELSEEDLLNLQNKTFEVAYAITSKVKKA